MSKFSYSNVRLGQNHGGERDNRREKQTIKKGNPSIRPFVRLLLLPEMMMGEVRGHTYMTSAVHRGLSYTERCKFVQAKLRESFCPAAASHSRPRQASA